ncbi:hypothetical protein TVAG_228910 [Trichomonas vaginalis G3]|uniref:Uncharacterized protein n=1 Tax=Trichomonas vaginalis (strain ATCC PRA-98 / G3) TaxID=412133 RepID=A2DJ53_TRIV3|nr:hypothetical protein TVAGG3_0471100 [Trichomonas vaginalis G3]EAY19628.1 hypothetical protein TVAG_228910 [Trichomonas vaginalis G3]KAI5515068.1 hypothetical protein TVAGG3_0471100 [Trichomonas vaginalis G3]|eukprot:XP_001580614.1 hypothetical protein [Trichomonas vaginalis G3]
MPDMYPPAPPRLPVMLHFVLPLASETIASLVQLPSLSIYDDILPRKPPPDAP